MSIEPYLERLAARTPAPGGAAGAAAACALAAALAEMAANFAELEIEAARAERLRARALELGELDRTVYAPVLKAAKLPKDDPTRGVRLRAALSDAAEPPLALAETAAEVRDLARVLAESGRPWLRGDALAGAEIATGAARAAALLVELNLAELPDDPRLQRARAAAA